MIKEGDYVETPYGTGTVEMVVNMTGVATVVFESDGVSKDLPLSDLRVVSKDFGSYCMSDTVVDELNNSLLIVNSIVKQKELDAKPIFYILGGAAMVFHKLNYETTLDIDVANRISNEIREDVSVFISDNASEVTKLGAGYERRAVRIRPDLDSIEVYILSKPDLLISKLVSNRTKDYEAVRTSGIATEEVVNEALDIVEKEYTGILQLKLQAQLLTLAKGTDLS